MKANKSLMDGVNFTGIDGKPYSARFLTGTEATDFLGRYEAEVGKFGGRGRKSLLNKKGYPIKYKNGKITNASAVSTILANSILSEQGLRTANTKDLERVVEVCPEALESSRSKVNVALLVKSGEPDEGHNIPYIGSSLRKQILKRNPDAQFPVMINLYDFNIVDSAHGNNCYGLDLRLNDGARVNPAPQLDDGNIHFSETDNGGVPILDEKGPRLCITTTVLDLFPMYVTEDSDLFLHSDLQLDTVFCDLVVVEEK
jgi:hypothetical protein